MATRTYCDICKMELDTPYYLVVISGDNDTDLCLDCKNDLLIMLDYFKKQGTVLLK